jgi:hypothetical protein
LAACPPHERGRVSAELRIVQEDVALGVNAKQQVTDTTIWDTWQDFCLSLHADPTLHQADDPVTLLQLFAHRYRRGEISPSRSAVKGKTVGDALRAVGQTISNMGYQDPRLLPSGKLNFRLSRQLSSYNKRDPPPSRVKPIPIQVLHTACRTLRLATHPRSTAIADMITLGFYFLLRPGEYAASENPDSTPYRLQDVHLRYNHARIDHLHGPVELLHFANFVCLEFTNQKNGVQGELIGLGRSGNNTFCPVQAVISRVIHLRQHFAPPDTPLYTFFSHQWMKIPTSSLTKELRIAIAALGHTVGLSQGGISVRSLRASGAMAPLCAKVDPDRIRLLERWRSDEMLRYLHVQAYPVVADLAPAMLQQGAFTLLPNQPPQPRILPAIGGNMGPVGNH